MIGHPHHSLKLAFLLAVILAVGCGSDAYGQDRNLKQKVAEHRANVERSIAESRERSLKKREEMRRRREAMARATPQGEDRNLKQKVAEHRANVERSIAESRERSLKKREEMRRRIEAAKIDRGQRAKHVESAASDHGQRATWYWAKQASLLGTLLAAAVGHFLASRRKENEANL